MGNEKRARQRPGPRNYTRKDYYLAGRTLYIYFSKGVLRIIFGVIFFASSACLFLQEIILVYGLY